MRKFVLLILFSIFQFINYAQTDDEIQAIAPELIIYDMCNDGDGLWLATYGKGIFYYSFDTGKLEEYSTDKGNIQQNVFYCITCNDRFVWAGSVDGLFIYDKQRKRWNKRKFGKGGQLSNWIRSIEFDPYINAVWIGRFKYLTKYDIRSRRFIDYDLTVKGNAKTNTIKAIQTDGDTLVWFGTEAGLHKYQKAKRFETPGAVFFYDNRLNYFNGEGDAVSISDLLFEQNNIWIGLDEFKVPGNEDYNIGGIYRFDRGNDWWRFDKKDGLEANGVFALEKTGNYIWASLYQFSPQTKEQYGRGIVIIHRTTKKIKMLYDERIPSTIYTMHFDGNDLWLGSDRGLIKINLQNKLAYWE